MLTRFVQRKRYLTTSDDTSALLAHSFKSFKSNKLLRENFRTFFLFPPGLQIYKKNFFELLFWFTLGRFFAQLRFFDGNRCQNVIFFSGKKQIFDLSLDKALIRTELTTFLILTLPPPPISRSRSYSKSATRFQGPCALNRYRATANGAAKCRLPFVRLSRTLLNGIWHFCFCQSGIRLKWRRYEMKIDDMNVTKRQNIKNLNSIDRIPVVF